MKNKALQQAGLKATLPRLKILKILQDAEPHHLNAEEVHSQLIAAGEEVGLATVYRVLMQFQAAGLVRRYHFEGDRAIFEIDNGQHHDHLVCLQCNAVQEFVDEAIEQRQQIIAQQANFRMTDHNLTIYGFCQQCS